jgi:TLC domain
LFFECSTPFLNVHWFTDKVNLTGSLLQLINGIVLMVTFFSARIVWGWYITFNFIRDVYRAREMYPDLVPLWLFGFYIFANVFLNSLNLYWFSKMIDSMRRRAEIREKMVHEHHE